MDRTVRLIMAVAALLTAAAPYLAAPVSRWLSGLPTP